VTQGAKQPIPVIPLVSLYRILRKASQEQRLRMATELAAEPDQVAARVAESIDRFEVYDNKAEAFCLPHRVLDAPAAVINGRTLAAALSQGEQQVAGPESFGFRLVDYEVRPARTTKNALLALNRFDDGRPSTAAMSLDLLLRHDDGTPIVGEVKVAKAGGYDTDSVLALVQALAAAAQLATPNQRIRLLRHYPHTFLRANRVDVAIIAYHPPKLPEARYQQRLGAVARDLARGLLDSPRFPSQIRRIDFMTAHETPAGLTVRAG
jgi:hypothetical protein